MAAGAEPADSVALKMLLCDHAVCPWLSVFSDWTSGGEFQAGATEASDCPSRRLEGEDGLYPPEPDCASLHDSEGLFHVPNLRHQKQGVLANLLQSVRKTLNEEEAHLRCLKADLNLPSLNCVGSQWETHV